MKPCHEYAVRALRYLDNDLKEKELEDFRSHLESCLDCRACLDAEKALSQTLHRSRPLYSAPASLRDRVAAMVAQHSEPNRVQGRVDQRGHRIFGNGVSGVLERLLSWRILAPATVMIALCLAFVPGIVRNVQAASELPERQSPIRAAIEFPRSSHGMVCRESPV
jgi:anti-sigma factor RsiW